MLRRSFALVVAALSVATVLGTASAALAGPGEYDFVSRANSARAAAGRVRYRVASDLVAVARRHSAEMAARGSIWHNPRLASEVSGWSMVGENVGMGGDVASIHAAFMNSAPHRANILDRDFTEIGVGTATGKNGTLYVTQVFRLPARRAVSAAPTRSAPVRTTTRAPQRAAAVVHRKPVAAAPTLRSRVARATALRRSARAGLLPQAVSYVAAMHAVSD
ncbi:MAG: CAP domain-containing protein [Mycobacteriales bacterium]|nr:CAP domain-containing protein [Frankia sp.]